jgi:hypothetical protein
MSYVETAMEFDVGAMYIIVFNSSLGLLLYGVYALWEVAFIT